LKGLIQTDFEIIDRTVVIRSVNEALEWLGGNPSDPKHPFAPFV